MQMFKEEEGIHNCTLDITLFFMIVRGLGIDEAAALQNLHPNALVRHLSACGDTPAYAMLTRYYTALRRKRDERRPKGKAV